MNKKTVLIAMLVSALVPAVASEALVDRSAPAPAPEVEPVAAPPDCPDNSWRTVRLICADGAIGSAAGVYGGTPFGVFCDSGIGETSICASGTSYGMRIGQNHPRGVDCAFFGDSIAVAEKCDRLQLVIAGSPGGS
jgi:hypothetical protein